MKNRNSIFTMIPLLICCLASLPKAQAVVPAPDGGYPGGNTAEGQSALFSLTTGGYNTAVGFFSLRSDTTGQLNTASGAGALLTNTVGVNNTANGAFALFSNTGGANNTANGLEALFSNTGGINNTAIGVGALQSNTNGYGNTALGISAGNGVTTANNVICIGTAGANVSDSCYIGNIFGTEIGFPALYVFVDSAGKLGTRYSARRFKRDIQPMDKASEAILSLKPVTFHYKSDVKSTPCFGLIAEDVAKVNPDLVVRDKNGDLLSVRYDQVNAMLLNEFLKEHKAFLEEQRKVQEQEASITQLKSTVAKQQATIARQQNDFETNTAQQQKEIQALTASLTKQAAQIQRVTDQLAAASPSRGGLEMSKFATGRIRRGGPAPQIVLNKP